MEEVYGRAELSLKRSLAEMTIAGMSAEIEMRYLENLKSPVGDDAPRASRPRPRKGASVASLPPKAAPRAARRSVG